MGIVGEVIESQTLFSFNHGSRVRETDARNFRDPDFWFVCQFSHYGWAVRLQLNRNLKTWSFTLGREMVPELHAAALRHPRSVSAEHARGDARRGSFRPAWFLSNVVGPVQAIA